MQEQGLSRLFALLRDQSDLTRRAVLGDEVLAKLDELVPAFAAESADAESRSSVVRKLINREHARRTKQKGK